jgi:hypothetical protein
MKVSQRSLELTASPDDALLEFFHVVDGVESFID